jgi:hypothetical protein
MDGRSGGMRDNEYNQLIQEIVRLKEERQSQLEKATDTLEEISELKEVAKKNIRQLLKDLDKMDRG